MHYDEDRVMWIETEPHVFEAQIPKPDFAVVMWAWMPGGSRRWMWKAGNKEHNERDFAPNQWNAEVAALDWLNDFDDTVYLDVSALSKRELEGDLWTH